MRLGLVFAFTLCCGGLFATTSTARSKRAHASGCNSGSFFGSGLAMTVTQEFESPKSKLARARHHISGLESEIQKLIAGIRFERIIEPITPSHGSLYDRWLRKYAHDCAMEGRAPQEPPDATAYVHKIHFQSLDISNLEPVAGDAIQNLRQALDHAACSCARLSTRPTRAHFSPWLNAQPN